MLNIFTLFSARMSPSKVHQIEFETLPANFRNAVVNIIVRCAGRGIKRCYSNEPISNRIYRRSVQILRDEKGLLQLSSGNDVFDELLTYFLRAANEDALDALDVIFTVIYEERASRNDQSIDGFRVVFDPQAPDHVTFEQSAEDGIEELNRRFGQYNLGYRFEGGVGLVKVTSNFSHTNIVAPAIQLLHRAQFKGANDEFSSALKHLRNARHREAIQLAGCALESTLKTICDRRKWKYEKTATVRQLLEIVFKFDLVPEATQHQFQGLRAILESAVPTARNRHGAHGSGSTPLDVPEYVATFVIHSCAASILLLVEADTAKRK